MRINELYPYWDDIHEDLLGTVQILTEEQLDYAPHGGAQSIRQIVLAMVYEERYLIGHLVGGYEYERPRASEYPGGPDLVELINAAREVTAIALDPFTAVGLKSVRTMPADAKANQPETNVPVGWLFWRMMEREIFCYGQIRLRLEDREA